VGTVPLVCRRVSSPATYPPRCVAAPFRPATLPQHILPRPGCASSLPHLLYIKLCVLYNCNKYPATYSARKSPKYPRMVGAFNLGSWIHPVQISSSTALRGSFGSNPAVTGRPQIRQSRTNGAESCHLTTPIAGAQIGHNSFTLSLPTNRAKDPRVSFLLNYLLPYYRSVGSGAGKRVISSYIEELVSRPRTAELPFLEAASFLFRTTRKNL